MTDSDTAAQAWKLLVELTMLMRSRWVALANELEMTPIQAMALRLLDPEQPSPMSALAEGLVCDPSNVTGIVDKLEARGLLERQPAENDWRIKMLVVTAKGIRLRSRLIERMLEPPDALKALPEAQQRCLYEATCDLLRTWDARG